MYKLLVLSKVDGRRKNIIGTEKFDKIGRCKRLAERHRRIPGTTLSIGFTDVGPGAPGWAYSHFRSLSKKERKVLGLRC